ncbi:MAG: hypothetical protein KR126chlam6_00067 [Candidatus Anoxychlamydiales bacterium]|nr:hypothetical protein [Candidatus Anoxychlamydiales bacterium]
MIIHIIAYLVVGILSGILAGLLGIGGGIIIVPSLFFLYTFLDVGIASPMHVAVGTSLAIITVTSVVAMLLYEKRQAIFWSVFKQINIPLIIGSFLGVLVSYLLTGEILSQIFAGFALLFGAYFLFFKKVHKRHKKPEKLLSIFLGLAIGVLATMLGIGGGVIGMPLFIMLLRVPNYSLVGTAATATFITSLVGTLSYLITGFNIIDNIHSIGYIHLPSFASIGIISIFSVYFGIKLADKLHVRVLKKIFALALIATSIFMFFK